MDYDQVVGCLKRVDLPLREIVGEQGGRAAVSPAGGRVVALRVDGVRENLFHTNPAVADPEALSRQGAHLRQGFGGLRLWFAPEYAYSWKGRPDTRRFTNYHLQAAADPGRYTFAPAAANTVRLKMAARLRDWRDAASVSFAVERIVAPTPAPLELRGLRYMGIRLQHRLELRQAPPDRRVDLWHILQMPPGSRLLVPTRGAPRPLVYFNAQGRGGWRLGKDALEWSYRGTAEAKIGLDTGQVTGRTGVLRPLENGEYAAVIWHFPVSPGMHYVDGPSATRARRQIVQAWDGFGFGEMEVHSPSVGAEDPIYADHSLLWCFVGSKRSINRVARELMQRSWS